MLGNYSAAIADFKQVLTLNPSDSLRTQAQNQLDQLIGK
jgi:hypothetical protein